MAKKSLSVVDISTLLHKTAEKLYECKLNPEVLKPLTPTLKKLTTFLSLDDTNQTMLFSLVYISNYTGGTSSLREMIEFLDITRMNFIPFIPSLNALIEKRYIYSYFSSSVRTGSKHAYDDLVINDEVLEAINTNKPVLNHKFQSLDIYSFCHKVSDLLEERNNEKIDTEILFLLVQRLEQENLGLNAVIRLNDMKISIENRTLLYEVCDDLIQSSKFGFTNLELTLKHIYKNTRVRVSKVRELIEQKSELIDHELINVHSGSFINDFTITLTQKAIDIFLEGDAYLFTQKKYSKNLKSNHTIVAKNLFFDSGLEGQLEFLRNALKQENFNSMQQRMCQMTLNKGLTAIFHGPPGTGKTASVYQLAKETGRDIFTVDISQTKSMWFGESEKRIKELFVNYKRIYDASEHAPVLLFNEADAVLSRRKENRHSPTSNTENAIQNILLEEMENFEGILIATTNLITNLDTAFERRFMFKIEFRKPTLEAKKQIWIDKMPWLASEEVVQLATQFSFTGGEIDNIVRKATLNEVVTGNRPTIHELVAFCEEERFAGEKKKVGY